MARYNARLEQKQLVPVVDPSPPRDMRSVQQLPYTDTGQASARSQNPGENSADSWQKFADYLSSLLDSPTDKSKKDVNPQGNTLNNSQDHRQLNQLLLSQNEQDFINFVQNEQSFAETDER